MGLGRAGRHRRGPAARSRRRARSVGWGAEAAALRLSAAQGALALGDAEGARADLLPSPARAAPARPPSAAAPGRPRRGCAWRAATVPAPAARWPGRSSARAHRAALGAADLRAHAGAWATEPARLGVRMALEDGRAAEVLAWAERHRAGALHLPPARPPEDPALAAAFDELRRAAAEREEAIKEGADAAGLARRQAELERLVQERSRHAEGTVEQAAGRSPRERSARRSPAACWWRSSNTTATCTP